MSPKLLSLQQKLKALSTEIILSAGTEERKRLETKMYWLEKEIEYQKEFERGDTKTTN